MSRPDSTEDLDETRSDGVIASPTGPAPDSAADESPGQRFERIRAAGFLAGGVDVGFASLASFAAGVYAARVFDPEVLGAYALFFAAFTAVTMISTQGIFIPAEVTLLDVAESARLRGIPRSWRVGTLVAALSAPVVLIALVIARNALDGDDLTALAITAVVVSFLSPIQDHLRRLQHLGNRSENAAVMSTVQIVVTALVILVAIDTDIPAAWVPFGALCIANVCSLTAGWLLIVGSDSAPTEPLPITSFGRLVDSGRWLLVAGLLPRIARFGAGAVVLALVSAEDLGFAEAGRVLARPLLVLTAGLAAVINPRAMSAWREGAVAEVNQLKRIGARVVLGVGAVWILVAGVSWTNNPIAELLPNAFATTGLTAAMIAATSIAGVLIAQRAILISARKERELAGVETVGAVGVMLIALAAGLIGAFAIPLGLGVLGIVRWIGYRRLTPDPQPLAEPSMALGALTEQKTRPTDDEDRGGNSGTSGGSGISTAANLLAGPSARPGTQTPSGGPSPLSESPVDPVDTAPARSGPALTTIVRHRHDDVTTPSVVDTMTLQASAAAPRTAPLFPADSLTMRRLGFTVMLSMALLPLTYFNEVMIGLTGLRLGGLSWFAVLGTALLAIALTPLHTRSARPVWAWIVFVLYLTISLAWTANVTKGLQTLAQFATPLVVYFVAYHAWSPTLVRRYERLARWMIPFGLVSFVVLDLMVGDRADLFGPRPWAISLIALFVIATRAARDPWAVIVVWALMLGVITVSGSRMAAATFALLIFFAPVLRGRPKIRLGLLVGVIAAAAVLFSTPLLQERFFHNDSGTFGELIRLENSVNTAGRSNVWPLLLDECGKSFPAGAGVGSSFAITSSVVDSGGFSQPHNEFIRTYCEAGAASVFYWVFVAGIGLSSIGAVRRNRHGTFGWSLLQMLVALVLLSATDNVLIYTIIFMIPFAVILAWSRRGEPDLDDFGPGALADPRLGIEQQAMPDPTSAERGTTVALAIPAYNEADGIAGFLRDLDATLSRVADHHSFVVVNDVSTDNTVDVLEGLRSELSGDLIVETNAVNSGHGPTVLRAYRRALDTGASWILQVDGDGQFEADDIELLLNHGNAGAAIVTGQRRVRFDPWYRKVVTGALPWMLRGGFGVRRRDINCPFRLYEPEVLRGILSSVPDDSLTPHVLMTVLEEQSGHRCVEVPVRHRPRRGDTETGTTWRTGANIIVPMKLVRFLRDALDQLMDFRRTL